MNAFTVACSILTKLQWVSTESHVQHHPTRKNILRSKSFSSSESIVNYLWYLQSIHYRLSKKCSLPRAIRDRSGPSETSRPEHALLAVTFSRILLDLVAICYFPPQWRTIISAWARPALYNEIAHKLPLWSRTMTIHAYVNTIGAESVTYVPQIAVLGTQEFDDHPSHSVCLSLCSGNYARCTRSMSM